VHGVTWIRQFLKFEKIIILKGTSNYQKRYRHTILVSVSYITIQH
jgi:hypothetical protein